ncbi:transposase [Shewanella indica]|uniref:transposase n=1 Tax=Shewanella indica TaxID=768528 RepID=UPI003D35E2D7
MSGKHYPEEFQVGAVKQLVDRSHSIADVAHCLDIPPSNLIKLKRLLIPIRIKVQSLSPSLWCTSLSLALYC